MWFVVAHAQWKLGNLYLISCCKSLLHLLHGCSCSVSYSDNLARWTPLQCTWCHPIGSPYLCSQHQMIEVYQLSHERTNIIIIILATDFYCLHAVPSNPSCLQTTVALLSSQESSQTVPHWLLRKTSTLPSFGLVPSTSRTAPGLQSASWAAIGT